MDPSRTDDVRFHQVHPVREAREAAVPPVVTDTDRLVARVLLTGVVVGAAWLALRLPTVRRLAWRAVRGALVSGLPALLAREARGAWRASADASGDAAGDKPRPPAPAPQAGPSPGA